MEIDVKLVLEYSKSLNVLYVEDDPILSKLCMQTFLYYFKTVDVAYDGLEGVERYKKYYEENDCFYDIILSDINMPKLDGIGMARVIKSENIEQSIVFITAHDEARYLLEAVNIGAEGFLAKPMEIDQLNRVLYSVTQKVFEHKLVIEYYKEIEKLNLELQEMNTELLLKNKELDSLADAKVVNSDIEVIETHEEVSQISEPKEEPISLDPPKSDLRYNESLDTFEEDDVRELAELCMDIDVAIIAILAAEGDDEAIDKSLHLIIEGFSRFSSIISYYTIFNNLTSALKEFIISLQENELPATYEEISDIFTLVESFVFVLKKWQVNLENREFESINYLDASLISDMHTIVMMYSSQVETGGELDFF